MLANRLALALQARASRLSFTDIVRRLAALPKEDSAFVSSKVCSGDWPVRVWHGACFMLISQLHAPPAHRHS